VTACKRDTLSRAEFTKKIPYGKIFAIVFAKNPKNRRFFDEKSPKMMLSRSQASGYKYSALNERQGLGLGKSGKGYGFPWDSTPTERWWVKLWESGG
jgi:hypothetical protein